MDNIFTPVCFNQLYEVIKFLPWSDLIKIKCINRDIYDFCKRDRLVQTLIIEKKKMCIKRYRCDECTQLDPNVLIHEDKGNGIVRKWENKKGEIVGEYKLDGSMKLEDMIQDMISCLEFTSLHDINYELYQTVYETKLPVVKEVRRCHCMYFLIPSVTEMFKSSTVTTVIPIVPTNYHELFSIIGSEIDLRHQEPITIGQNDEKKYKVYLYNPGLYLKIKDDVICYGYCR